jgi:hypothetical protein
MTKFAFLFTPSSMFARTQHKKLVNEEQLTRLPKCCRPKQKHHLTAIFHDARMHHPHHFDPDDDFCVKVNAGDVCARGAGWYRINFRRQHKLCWLQ